MNGSKLSEELKMDCSVQIQFLLNAYNSMLQFVTICKPLPLVCFENLGFVAIFLCAIFCTSLHAEDKWHTKRCIQEHNRPKCQRNRDAWGLSRRTSPSQASKKVVEIPVYKDTYRTSFSQGHFVTTLSDSPSAAAAPAESHEAVHTAVHSIGGSGSGAPQRLGLMMAGPLKGKIVPVDADGRPMADADTRAVPTAPPAPAPAAALVPAVASQPAAAAPTGHALGLLVGGPLAGQVVPVDSDRDVPFFVPPHQPALRKK